MSEFWNALGTYEFLQYAVIAGLLASVVCGVMGSYVVVRRISFISGGIAHSVLGGMGIAYYLQRAHDWPVEPIHGAIAAAIVAALIIGVVSQRVGQHEDTVIGALWAVGMAVGVIFISRTPGYNTDLMRYLFGDILLVRRSDLFLIFGIDIVVIALVVLLYNKFLAVCFDAEFSRLRGIKVDFYYLLLLCLIALTVVILIEVVGLILVIALLTIPAAIAGKVSRSLWQMMIIAALLGSLFTISGLAVSYGPDLPSGAMIIVVAGACYLVSVVCKGVISRHRNRRQRHGG